LFLHSLQEEFLSPLVLTFQSKHSSSFSSLHLLHIFMSISINMESKKSKYFQLSKNKISKIVGCFVALTSSLNRFNISHRDCLISSEPNVTVNKQFPFKFRTGFQLFLMVSCPVVNTEIERDVFNLRLVHLSAFYILDIEASSPSPSSLLTSASLVNTRI
jgi:hypothetical protein